MLENELVLSLEVPGGGTQRDALAIVRPDDERLKDPNLNRYEEYLFWVFWTLNTDRNKPYSGVGSIPLRAYVDYQTLFDDVLLPEELHVLRAMDRTYIATVTKFQEKPKDN